MGRKMRVIWLLIVAVFIGLAGCSESTAKKAETENKVNEQEGEQETENADEGNEPVKEEEEAQPIVVNVIEPTTQELVRSLTPEKMGYGNDNARYRAELEKWARQLARGTDTKPGYDQRMIPDKLGPDGQVIKGNPLIVLEEAELVEKILEASELGGNVELPLYVTASGYQLNDAAQLGEVVVGKYTTYFNASVAGRTKNIELSAEAINNVILGTGDVFSFNTTVGPSDEAHGYQPAEEIVNKKLVMGIGGGICQTSSTLYNAVDVLGVGYVEKHHHSLSVGYVPEGRDATVSYGGKDFRFENTTGVPLLLKAIVGKGSLTVEVRTSKEYQAQMKKGI
ncbi:MULTISPECIES: VanW family protein [unclassified Bacillus (in: firmicutes)]|uniref:VanW family protein n=1 Tax=unclassified Bacillus (in: firmicutes) TaxID=185979 RepID=UPI001BEA9294|nr:MULTISPECIES: VanW family protein [unclassified Bacillus (in: firmicutes)]MBT2637888.1 VanW family protein [Bacillus sp. ISL-39]MBT2661061.1 VanW family protein [Bacillus sp. ISL-45]